MITNNNQKLQSLISTLVLICSPTLPTRLHATYIHMYTTPENTHRVTSAMNIDQYCPFPLQDVDCGMPEQINNGMVTFNSTVYASYATYTCDSGYVLVGLEERVCEADGSWSNAAPACERRWPLQLHL